jgi:hypothetical protein
MQRYGQNQVDPIRPQVAFKAIQEQAAQGLRQAHPPLKLEQADEGFEGPGVRSDRSSPPIDPGTGAAVSAEVVRLDLPGKGDAATRAKGCCNGFAISQASVTEPISQSLFKNIYTAVGSFSRGDEKASAEKAFVREKRFSQRCRYGF